MFRVGRILAAEELREIWRISTWFALSASTAASASNNS